MPPESCSCNSFTEADSARTLHRVQMARNTVTILMLGLSVTAEQFHQLIHANAQPTELWHATTLLQPLVADRR